VLPELVDTK